MTGTQPFGAETGQSLCRRGIMLVLSSPSGAGKTSISRRLLANHPEITLSVSVTTRCPRPGEIDGVHYHFVDQDTFKTMILDHTFIEYADDIYGQSYGTPRAPVESALAAGHDVLFDVEWRGTKQLAAAAGDDLVTIFVLPPSAGELEQRLRQRNQDTPEEIARRLAQASTQISHWENYDYVLINDDFEHTISAAEAILTAERLRRQRQTGLSAFVSGLTSPKTA